MTSVFLLSTFKKKDGKEYKFFLYFFFDTLLKHKEPVFNGITTRAHNLSYVVCSDSKKFHCEINSQYFEFHYSR